MLPYSSSRGRHAAPPDATTSTGCAAHEPVADVDIVQVLLDDLVAGDPDEASTSCGAGIPCRPTWDRACWLGNSAALLKFSTGRADPVGVHGDDVAELAVLQALVRSRYHACERRCAPDFTVSFSSSDFFAAAMKRRRFTGSVANGFSQKMCFLASTAASKCIGRYAGYVASMTMSHGLDHFLIGVEADEVVLGVDLDAVGELRA